MASKESNDITVTTVTGTSNPMKQLKSVTTTIVSEKYKKTDTNIACYKDGAFNEDR